jgi:hypothetical protein
VVIGSANMAEITATPTVRSTAFMMSSSDINDEPDSTAPGGHPQGDLGREEGHNLANDGPPNRPVQNGGAAFYDSAYTAGRIRTPPPSQENLESTLEDQRLMEDAQKTNE